MNAYVRQHKIKPRGLRSQWIVRLLGHNSQASLYSPLRVAELHVVPEFSGGGGGFVKIVIGAVLIAAAVVATYLTGGAASPLLAMAISTAFGLGISLVLGGLLELLSPAPKNTANQNLQSVYLGAPQNTTAIGTFIPIGYGRFPVYGQILSFALEADPTILDTTGRQMSTVTI